MLRMQLAQIVIGRRNRCDVGQHRGGRDEISGAVDGVCQLRRIEPAAAGMPGIFQHGKRKLGFGIGECCGIGRREQRHDEARRLEPPVVGLADLVDRGPGSGRQRRALDPQRLVGIGGVVGFDGGDIIRVRIGLADLWRAFSRTHRERRCRGAQCVCL